MPNPSCMLDLHGISACSTCLPASSIPFTIHQGEARDAYQDALLKPMSRHWRHLRAELSAQTEDSMRESLIHATHTIMIAVSLSPALSGGEWLS